MISKLQLLAMALAGILVGPVAGAQARNLGSSAASAARPPAARSAQHPARVMAHAAGHVARAPQRSLQPAQAQSLANGRVAGAFVPGVNSESRSGVPGLGFDFPHLAAVGGDVGNNGPSRFGLNGRLGRHDFVPILFGSYPYYADDSGSDQTDQQPDDSAQPPSDNSVAQQPDPPSSQEAGSGRDAGNLSAAPAEDAVPDVGDFVLVRRDGRILFASLFSVIGTQVRYITPDGMRHTIAISDLDSDATVQMNEARGTTVQLRD